MADFSSVFGPFGPALDPAMGRILSTNPEALIPFFAAQGISPPKNPTKLASLGGGVPDAAGGQPPLEAGYPEQPDVLPTSTPSPTAADAIRGYQPEPSPTETPPTSEPLPPGYTPPGPGEPGYIAQAPTVPAQDRSVLAPTGPEIAAGNLIRRGREAITGAFSAEDPEAAVYGGAGAPPAAPGAAAAPAAPAAPGAGAAAAPPMAPGTGFNTFGALGGLYPAAVPGGGGGAGEEAITGVPLPPSDPRRQGGAAAAGGTTGKSQQEAIKQLSAALAGIKAPPQPAAPQLRPAVAHGGNISQNNPLASFLAQYMSGQGGAAPTAPLRLYQTVGGK